MPVLGWQQVSGAASYQVELLANDIVVDSADTTNRRLVFTDRAPYGTLTWRVRAVDSEDRTSRWASATFTHQALPGPVQLRPADGSTLAQPEMPPILGWRAVSGATSYHVEVDDSLDFVGAETYSGPGDVGGHG